MNGLCFRVFGVRFVSILAAVFGSVMAVQAQVELDAIPAPVGGTVSVCAGSTVLFFNDTDADLLYGETEFTWLLDGDPLSAEGSGPVAEVFDVPGTYELTLQIVTLGGTDILDPATLTVEVSAFPDVVPTLGPGNTCTIESVDPLTELTTFQTQSGASCTCTNASMGPAIALLNTDQYPEGTVSRIHWGGAGSAANGGTAAYTDEFGPFPTTTPDLAQFAGQINPLGHYASQGSYNLIHEVIFPGGCVYTAYYVMSWGAAIIDLCGNSAQSVCVPLDYPLCFDSQDPGTTYHIDWGDGSEETFAYPNLPTAPNELTHSYPPSCTEIDGELVSQPYTLTITATNACNVLQTQNTQGPFYVSEAPVPQVSMSSSDDYCQYQQVTFTNSTTNTGTIASADGCSTEYTYSWFIVDTASIVAPTEGEDYIITDGFFGDWNDPQGSESITLEFDETGNYQVVLTASNVYCEPQSAAVNIAIGETPVAVDTTLTICTGQGIAFTPSGPGINLPVGTSLDWELIETNPSIAGAPQIGSSSSDVVMELPPLENLTNALQSVTYQVTPLGPAPGYCLGHPFNVTVNVAPGITLPNSIDLTICSGDEAFLEPVNNPPDFILPDGTTFSWEYEDNDGVQGETTGEDEPFFNQELVLEGSLYEVVEYQVNASLGEVENGCGNALFDIQVHVHDVQPGSTGPDSTLCFGADAYEIGFEPGGLPAAGGTMTIEWYASDSPSGPWTLVGSGNTYLPASPVVEATYYRAFVTSELNDVACTGFSSITSVELNVLEEISIGTNDTICAGDIPAEIALLGATDASWTYQWQNRPLNQGTWSDLAGANAASVQPAPLVDDTEFRLLVMNEEGGIICPSVTDAVTIEVNSVVSGILSSTQYLCEGQQPDSLQVDGAEGDGELTYEWVPSDGSGGVPSDSTYSPPVPSTDISYSVEVTSTLGGTACSAATDPINLLLNRVSAGVPSDSVLMHCVGDDPGPLVFNLNLPPSADGELGLQWQFMDASGVWTNVPGATDLGFDPSDALLEELQFRVVATSDLDGVVCSDTSAVWQLLLNQVDGGSLSTDQSICAGGIPSAITSAGNSLAEYSATYAWVSADNENGPWVDVIEGPATPIFEPFEPDALSADTWFALVVISTSGQVACRDTSDAVAVEVVPQPELYATSALSDTACVADVSDLDGLHDPFSVAYDFGTGDPTYTWYDADWQPIQSDTDSTFMPASSLEVGTYNYLVSVELTGSGCQPDTLADTLMYVVVGDPVVDSLLADASYCAGSTPLDLAVYMSGGHVEGAYDYAWYANGVDLEEGGATLTPDVSEVGDFYYYVEVTQTGAHCAVTSDSVLVEVEPGPTWTLQPEGVTVCAEAGSDVDLTVAFEGGAGDTTYTWHSSSTLEGPFAPEPMSDSATFVVSTEGPGLVYYYAELQLSGGCNAVLSDTVAVEVVPQPELYATSALSDTACVADVPDLDGLHDPFSVAYDFGTGDPTYTWYDADWQPIQSDTDSTFMPASSLEVGTYNYLVSVELTGSGCQPDTLADTLKYVVVGDPVVDSLLADASYCAGSTPMDLAVYVSGGHVDGVYDYAWYANGVDLEEGGATLTPDVSEVGDFYHYVEVTQTGAHCAVTSDSVLIEVEPGPTWTLQPEGVTVCAEAGSDVDLAVAFAFGAGDSTYTWYSSSVFDGPYEQVNPLVDSSVYEVPTEVPGLAYYYVELQLSGGCDAVVSDTVEVGVNDIYPGTLLENDTICSGEIPMELEVVDLDWLDTPGWAQNVSLQFNWLESSTSDGPFSSVQNNPDASIYNPGMLSDTTWFAAEVTSIWNQSACKDTTQVVEIVVNPLPVLSVIGDTICNTMSAEIPLAADFGNTELTYSWSAAYDEPDVDGEELTLQTLPVGLGGPELTNGPLENTSSEPDSVVYSITGVVNATGCFGHTEATVLVMPELTLDAATDIICSGGDVTLNLDELVNVESTFEWYALPNAGIQDATTNSVSNPNTSAVIQDVLTNLTNGDQTQFYFVMPTSVVGQCEASSGIQLEVEVLPPLAVEFEDFEANDTVAVCSGEPFSIFLGASTSSGVLSWRARPNPLVAGPTLAWQNNSAVISEVLTHNQTDLQYVVYESKVLASGCLSPIDSIIVQVNPVPALQPLEDLTFCDGVSTGGVTLSADVPGSSIHWSHSNAAIGLSSMGDAGDVPSWITQNTSDAPLSSMVDVAVNFENRGVVCTGSTESFSVTVLPVPQVDPLGDLSLCELELQPAIPLTTTVSGSEFQWSVSNGALGLTAGNSPTEISAFVASNPSLNVGNTTVTVTPIFPHPTPNASNCIGSSISFQLEVFPAPQVLLDSDELCSGEAVAMDIATDLPSTWVWQANPLPEIQGETSSPAQSDSTIQDVLVNVTNSPVTVSYEVTPTSIAHGCVGQPAVFSAIVNPLPQVDFVVLDQVLCDSVSASFENLSVGPLDFEWDFGGGDGNQQEDPTVVFPNIGVYDVTLVATNPLTGCVDSTQQSLEVFETPDPAFTWSDSSSCGPANVEFTATTLDASWDYLWDFGDGGTSDQVGVSGNLYAPGGCYDVSLTVTGPSGCTATQLVPELFCAFHQPNASFYPDPAVVTTLEPEVKFVNQSAFATNYFWYFGDGYTSFDEEPVHTYSEHGVYQVTLNAAIPDGCSESATAQVTVKPALQVYVPNAFTADMDGLDDSWCPLLSDASLVNDYQLWVYNRWGDLVFSSETPGERWLGAYDGGAHFVPNDVYTWVLALDVPPNVAFDCVGASALEGASSDCTLRGHVTILR